VLLIKHSSQGSVNKNMNKLELRASMGLAGVYALRMLGMFLILPVFAIYAGNIPGGSNHTLVGIALGAYGLTQALLQLPFGMWSDKVGRKKVIYIGLAMFAAGSFLCAIAPHIIWMIVGRSLQGAGAISAAVTALLADLTREENRTKAMAMIGVSIAATFAVSLVLAPPLFQWIGLSGIFTLTGVLAILAILGVAKIIPTPVISRFHSDAQTHTTKLIPILKNPQLLRLNIGIFTLHTSQMAMFVVLPFILQKATGLVAAQHWYLYLPVVLVSFILMVPAIIWGEKKDHLKIIFLGAIAFILIAQVGLAYVTQTRHTLLIILLIYFVGFNILEATLPSLISKIAPADSKGTAIGVYNTTQSFGIFVGGVLAGSLFEYFGSAMVFIVCAVAVLIWLLLALTMQAPQAVKTQMFHIGEHWRGDAVALSTKLAGLFGVKEAIVVIDERVAYLKVAQNGWDEAGARGLIKETN
jgi:predicted MFS family arabinose efflux permease